MISSDSPYSRSRLTQTEGKEKHLEEALEHPVPPRRPVSPHAAVAPSHCPAGAQDPVQELKPSRGEMRALVPASATAWHLGVRA